MVQGELVANTKSEKQLYGNSDLNDSQRNTKNESEPPKSPVCEWWRDLHAWCEPECMTYLQSKPIQNSPLSHRDGTSSPSGLSSNISGSSMLSHNSMSSSTKS